MRSLLGGPRDMFLDKPYAEIRRVTVRQFLGNRKYYSLVITDSEGNLCLRLIRTAI